MRRHHAISPGFPAHYQDLGISSLKWHDSAYNLILSVLYESYDAYPCAAAALARPPLSMKKLTDLVTSMHQAKSGIHLKALEVNGVLSLSCPKST